jgi:hypothetical protein
MSRLVIRKLRILGLAGRPPAQADVEATIRGALAGTPAAVAPDPPRRLNGGRTLGDAADAIASAIGGKKEPRT